VGIGVCNMDDHGRFVLAKTPILEVDTDEALGFLTDLNWVYHSQLDTMDFELDFNVWWVLFTIVGLTSQFSMTLFQIVGVFYRKSHVFKILS
jgi:hypothetical protein